MDNLPHIMIKDQRCQVTPSNGSFIIGKLQWRISRLKAFTNFLTRITCVVIPFYLLSHFCPVKTLWQSNKRFGYKLIDAGMSRTTFWMTSSVTSALIFGFLHLRYSKFSREKKQISFTCSVSIKLYKRARVSSAFCDSINLFKCMLSICNFYLRQINFNFWLIFHIWQAGHQTTHWNINQYHLLL